MTRNYSIDILKFVCAILIVFLHTDWEYKQYLLPFTRCAVPCFFMISGFLLFEGNDINPNRLKKNIIHMAKITLWASILFFVLKQVLCLHHNGAMWLPSFNDMLDWVVFNQTPFGYHLWYLFAYLYVLLIVVLVNRYNKWNYLFYLTPLLIVSELIFGKYSLLIIGFEPNYIYVRNFLFVGLPFFTIGVFIKKRQEKIYSLFTKITNKYLVITVILFTVFSYLEKYLLISIGKDATRDQLISSTFLAISIFLLTLSHGEGKKSWASEIGEKDTLYIYILHPIFIDLLIGLCLGLQLYRFYFHTAPFLVLLFTMLFVFIAKVTITNMRNYWHRIVNN